MSFDPDPSKVIPFAVDFAVNALEAAYKEPSVKRFIFHIFVGSCGCFLAGYSRDQDHRGLVDGLYR